MFAIIAALFFALSLVGACAVIAYSVRQNIDAVTRLLKDYAEIGGASGMPWVSTWVIASPQLQFAPFDHSTADFSAPRRKASPPYRTSQKIQCGGGSVIPSAQRVAA
jgi:hypothetical protein